MIMTFNVFSNFKFNLYCTKAMFYRSKINGCGVYIIKRKKGEEGLIQVKEEEMYYC